MKDFTVNIYSKLLETLIQNGYHCTSYLGYLEDTSKKKSAILRHDVDKLPLNSLAIAKLQNTLGITGTYYFRIVKESFDINIIKEIYGLGHEIGYHYEDMDLANGDKDKAIKFFEKHLEMIRKIVPVRTICMHGSPLSKWDNKDLWKKYDYHKYDIIAEPYFDLDFNEFFYLTDTGRSWNASGVSVRDKVTSDINIKITSTADLIEKLSQKIIPKKIMFNFHPQRWTDNAFHWTRELIMQNSKNIVKSIIIKKT
ncbi:N/A [soil metagenome]